MAPSTCRTDFWLGDYIPSFLQDYNFESFFKGQGSIWFHCLHKVGSGGLWYPHKSRNNTLLSRLMTPCIHLESMKSWILLMRLIGMGRVAPEHNWKTLECKKGSQLGFLWWLWGGAGGSVLMSGWGWCDLNFLLAPKKEASSFLTTLLRCGQNGRGRQRFESCQKPNIQKQSLNHYYNKSYSWSDSTDGVAWGGMKSVLQLALSTWSLDRPWILSVVMTPSNCL